MYPKINKSCVGEMGSWNFFSLCSTTFHAFYNENVLNYRKGEKKSFIAIRNNSKKNNTHALLLLGAKSYTTLSQPHEL